MFAINEVRIVQVMNTESQKVKVPVFFCSSGLEESILATYINV